MNRLLNITNPSFVRLLKFSISGVIAAFVHLGMLYFLTEFFHWWYVWSTSIAFIVAFFVSFILQKFWTFESAFTKKIHIQISAHFFLATLNLLLNNILVYFLVEYGQVWYIYAQIIVTIIIATETFFILRGIFKQNNKGLPI